MKKVLFGGFLFLAGVMGLLTIFTIYLLHPYSYSGPDGPVMGFLVETKAIFVLIISLVATVVGFYKCYSEAHKE